MGEPLRGKAESLGSGHVSGEQDILFVERVGGGALIGRKERTSLQRRMGTGT